MFVNIWQNKINIWTIWGPYIPLTAEHAAAVAFPLLNDMPFFRKAWFCQKLTIFLNVWLIFANIYQYLSMYSTAHVPTYYVGGMIYRYKYIYICIRNIKKFVCDIYTDISKWICVVIDTYTIYIYIYKKYNNTQMLFTYIIYTQVAKTIIPQQIQSPGRPAASIIPIVNIFPSPRWFVKWRTWLLSRG